ncbi:DUF3343 domain-containing protein [Thermodesulfobacterium sp. TA1]|uniref:DUF3343 domain-containing protein n=1 Tax=Thermodesulfobacterium sp. TA1 TaxID=2234087 RepID=UPI0012319449|nr:DUF3343 domain-containing protein [Thermodesulfobacterium sp. TA1]QER42247.1 DUF3343 domain-containing protein [Thermodesulfobacterium sp. TA1]
MNWLTKFFLPKKEKTQENAQRALLIFENTSEVIQAEKVLQKEGYKVKVVGPPPEVRKGCDLAIEVPVVEIPGILNLLKTKKIEPLDFISFSEDEILKPVDLFNVKDFGEYLMVRAANMKITVDKKTLTIVNVSGGGCPDVPYLASVLVGKNLKDIFSLKDKGHTLCGYALHLAFKKTKELLCSE